MAEAAAAGVSISEYWAMTYRELAAVFEGEAIRLTRAHQLHLWAHHQGQSFARQKRLPDIRALLRKLEPERVMSAKELRAAIIGIAKSMGAAVVYRKKKG